MSVLYTCGNKNLNSVKLVADATKILIERNESNPISKIVLFSSDATQGDTFVEQVDIYKRILGDRIRVENVSLSHDGTGKVADFTAVFKEDSVKYIDLTNGQKHITAQLYLTASLLKIENIYYASLLLNPQEMPEQPVWDEHYQYVRLPPFPGIADLSRLSYFDLIFYVEELDKIFAGVPENSFVHRTCNDLRKSILSFFQGDNFRSAVSDATTSCEGFINYLLDFLISYTSTSAQNLARRLNVDLYRGDPLYTISLFFNKYSDQGCSDNHLNPIVTVPSLLTPLRKFRNISAHSGVSPHRFEANEVRICINLALEIFRCARASEYLWSELLTK